MQTQFSQFGYDKKTRSLSTFASDLGIRAVDPLPKEIRVQGEKQNVTFVGMRREFKGEGEDREVAAYVYESVELWAPITLRLWNT